MKRAVLYARVSTQQQRDNTSIGGQIEAMEKYAKQQGYKVVERVKVAHSGGYADLPGIQRLLEIGRNGEAGVVVVFKVDRFMRGDDADTDPGLDAAITERQLNKVGLEVEYLDLPDKDSEGYVWIKTLKRITASIERKNISERMTRGRRRKVQEGNVMTHGRSPYGYNLADVDGKRTLEVYEPEARVVRLIFTWYTVGDGQNGPLSMYAIANRLTAESIPTRGDTSSIVRKRTRRGYWTKGVVSKILHNETYAGTWYYGKQKRVSGKLIQNPRSSWLPLDVEPIIDPETWQRAQAQLSKNRDAAQRNTKYDYLMRRRVFCCECGTPMRAKTQKLKGEPFGHYRCPVAPGTLDYVKTCSMKTHFRVDQVDAAVWNWVKSFLTDPATLAEGLEAKQAEGEEANRPLRDRLDVVSDLLADNRRQLERALDLYLAGDFPREILTERKERLQATIDSLEREQADLAAQLEAQILTDEQVQTITEFAERAKGGLEVAERDFEKRRHLIELLDVRATLAVENGQKVAYAQCMMGGDTLSIAPMTS